MKQYGCFFSRRASFGVLPLIAVLALASNASAQLGGADPGAPATPDASSAQVAELAKRLIASSVENYGPDYKEVETAIGLFRSQDFEGAKSTLETLKKSRPELPPAGVILGQLFAAAKNPGAARNALEMAVRDEPADPEAFVVFADASFQQRRWTDADLLYRKAKGLVDGYSSNPKRKKSMSIRVASGMAGVAEVRERWAEAKSHLNTFSQLAPENVAAKTRLGRVLFMEEAEGSAKAAYAAFQSAYALDPEKVPRPEINMARLYQQKDDNARADKLFKLAMDRDKTSLSTQLAGAQWALDSGDLAMAKSTAEKARGINPDSFQVKLLDGILAAYESDFAKAAQNFESAHQAAPTNPAAVNQLAIALVEQAEDTQKRRALEYVQMNAQRYNDLSQQVGRETAVTQAWVLFKLGQKSKAAQLLQRTLQSGAVGSDSAYFAAFMLNELNQGPAAARLLKPVLKKSRIFPTRKQAETLLQQLGGAG